MPMFKKVNRANHMVIISRTTFYSDPVLRMHMATYVFTSVRYKNSCNVTHICMAVQRETEVKKKKYIEELSQKHTYSCVCFQFYIVMCCCYLFLALSKYCESVSLSVLFLLLFFFLILLLVQFNKKHIVSLLIECLWWCVEHTVRY